MKPSKSHVSKRRFRKDASVFKDWHEDTEIVIKRCFEHDKMQWKAARFIKDPEEVARCWKVIL